MGAKPFLTVGRGPTAERAFWREVRSAIEAHGNDGYTGTIAEKYEFVLVDTPVAQRRIDLARWALDFDSRDRAERLADMPMECEATVNKLAAIARDKFGPAVALRLSAEESDHHTPLDDDHLYLFFGWAPW